MSNLENEIKGAALAIRAHLTTAPLRPYSVAEIRAFINVWPSEYLSDEMAVEGLLYLEEAGFAEPIQVDDQTLWQLVP